MNREQTRALEEAKRRHSRVIDPTYLSQDERNWTDGALLSLILPALSAPKAAAVEKPHDNEEADQRLMKFLVKSIGGHSVTIIREGKRLIGWCSGRAGQSIAMRDLREEVEWMETPEPCPVCEKPFAAGDTCATDIDLGKCHAECLADSPTVDLETGEPVDGPIDTFPHVAPKAEAVTVKPLEWEKLDEVSYRATAIGLRYYVYLNSDDGLWHMYSEGYQPVNGEFTTSEEAKAAAQADYAARILSAIDTSPVPTLTAGEEAGGQVAAPPVAYMTEGYGYKRVFLEREAAEKLARGGDGEVTPLYASPIPALTDEAVERAAKAIHDGPLGASDEEDFGDNKASDWCREVARAALLAAFHSKGDE
ncbi:hypothetical protein ABWH97_00085 [Nitratireductor sp. ac15]